MARPAKETKAPTPKRDLYQEVTDTIVGIMEQGRIPWSKDWTSAAQSSDQAKAHALQLPTNAASGRSYSGINVLILWVSKVNKGYESDLWLSFKQAEELGGNVKKGEKSTLITYSSPFIPKEEKEAAEAEGREPRQVWMLKGYPVFNIDQVENLDLEKLKALAVKPAPVELAERTANLIKNGGIELAHGGDHAFYHPATDRIQMPHPDQFKDQDAYTRILFHEVTHWTGHHSRLNRDQTGPKGSQSYAREELVAELGSAYLSASMGIEPDTKANAAYLQSWIEVLKKDKKAIFTASAAAGRATDLLLSYDRDMSLDWKSKEPSAWSASDKEFARASLAQEQQEARFVGVSLEEYGRLQHRIQKALEGVSEAIPNEPEPKPAMSM